VNQLSFFHKIKRFNSSPDKYFCTFLYDSMNAKRTHRNQASTNRVGSLAIVRGFPGRDDGDVVIRIMVGMIHVCLHVRRVSATHPHTYAQTQTRKALFTVDANDTKDSELPVIRKLPLVAGE